MTIKQQGGVFGRNPTFNDVSVDDTLLVSNQIAVGTNTPVAGMALTLDGVGNYHGITLKANGSIIASLQQETSGNLYITTGFTGNPVTGKNLFIRTNGGSSVFTFKNSGDLAFASGKGIDFSATAGTGTSELFDDYEEGTWTPTLVGFTTAGDYTVTPTSGSATYVKIGKIVHVAARITITENSAGTGVAQFGGLPFTSGGNTRGFGMLQTIGVAYPASTLNAVVSLWTLNTTEFAINCVRDNSTIVSLPVTNIVSTDVVDFRMIYEVA